jgi:hypothetical protein
MAVGKGGGRRRFLLLDLERLLERRQIFANMIANGGNAERRLDVGCAVTLETQTDSET